uniref:Large ribosomal subunit protein P2 n=1 Tax=Esox lucius TaxID=8010 RepID=A0AAY5KCP7_ESOLU
MRYVAAYLLAVLGGNTSPSSKDIKNILGSVGIEAESERLDKVVNELSGKNINDVMNSGLSKLASVPSGGAVAAPAASAAGAAPAAGKLYLSVYPLFSSFHCMEYVFLWGLTNVFGSKCQLMGLGQSHDGHNSTACLNADKNTLHWS